MANINILREAIRGGKIFSVTFIKRTNGAERKMVCRTGVYKGLKGDGTFRFNPIAKGLLSVYDMQARDYRFIPTENVKEIKMNGEVYKFQPEAGF